MKPSAPVLVLSLVAFAAGCAALTPAPPPEQNAELRLDRGLAALDAGRYSQAFDDLAWVYSHCPARRAGSQALVAMAALDLDPRNPAARPDVGTELLARVIRDPWTPDWLRPMAETTFLTALGLGAGHPEGPTDSLLTADSLDHVDPEADVPQAAKEPPPVTQRRDAAQGAAPPEAAAAAGPAFGCGPIVAPADWVAPSLPTLPGPSMSALLARSQAVRDSLTGRAASLQAELDMTREELEATRAELDRIRQTLNP